MELQGGFEEIVKTRINLQRINYNYWINYNFLTWQWWVLFILSIIPWVIWWKLVDKKRKCEILIFGLLISIISTILDIAGADMVFWSYPIKLIPFMPPLLPMDISVLPVLYMLLYQYFSAWKYLVGLVLMAFIFSFLAEPLLVHLGIYFLNAWKHQYSFPIYIGMGLLFRLFVRNYTQNK